MKIILENTTRHFGGSATTTPEICPGEGAAEGRNTGKGGETRRGNLSKGMGIF